MRKTPITNLSASVRQRLLNLSKSTGDPFELVLTRYALERFLYRIGVSEYADQFVLKGAMLLAVWGGPTHRPTRDLDVLGYGNPSDDQLSSLFRDICRTEVEPDGLIFDAKSIAVAEIREQEEYDGRRVNLLARLEDAKMKVQVDIGFGDAVTPEADEISYPTLLDFPAPQIRAYPRESFISEKLQTMVDLGMPNSRMKDFYDLWTISQQFPLDGTTLVLAITATFDRRRTELPEETPIALTNEFAMDTYKTKQWKAFLNRIGLTDLSPSLPQITGDLKSFLLPPLYAAAKKRRFNQSWAPRGPWT